MNALLFKIQVDVELISCVESGTELIPTPSFLSIFSGRENCPGIVFPYYKLCYKQIQNLFDK